MFLIIQNSRASILSLIESNKMNASKSLSSIAIEQHDNDILLVIIKKLLEMIEELKSFKNKVNALQRLNEIDINEIVNTLLHKLNEEDKNKFKIGMEFMKNEIQNVLLL